MSITLAVASAEPDAGWGKLVALLVAAAAFWAFTEAHKRWTATRTAPSPTEKAKVVSGAKPQLNQGGGTDGTTAEKGAPAQPKEIDLWVGEQVGRRRTMDIVREAQRRFGASKRTTLRLIDKAKKARRQDTAP